MDNSHDSNKPVAWAVYWGHTFAQKHSVYFSQETANMAASEIKSFPTEVRPLYTSPQPARLKTLTDEDERKAFELWWRSKYDNRRFCESAYEGWKARAAHNIKENT